MANIAQCLRYGYLVKFISGDLESIAQLPSGGGLIFTGRFDVVDSEDIFGPRASAWERMLDQ